MSFLKGILNDLRQRKLWPVPLALVAAIVAVPVLLSKQATTPAAPLPLTHTPVAGSPVAAVSVATTSPDSHPRGSARDPFTQQKQPQAQPAQTGSSGGASAAGSSSSSTISNGASSSGSAGTGASSGGKAVSSTPASGSSSLPTVSGPSPVAPGAKPSPAPSGLTAEQSYDVALSITNSSGGLNQIASLERLSPVPSNSRALLVELGVLEGGKQVLFAVQPGTVLSGAGTCTPGPIDCEILSLRQDQTETIGSGGNSVASFAVTGITATTHGSTADASKARRQESTIGRALISNSPLSALSLFHYDPTVGAVVDLRNLTVGGN